MVEPGTYFDVPLASQHGEVGAELDGLLSQLKRLPMWAKIDHIEICFGDANLVKEMNRESSGDSAPGFWIMEQDARSDVPKNTLSQHRRVLYHELRAPDGKRVTCRPDAAAILSLPHPRRGDAELTSLAIHFEIDRSTGLMP